MNKNNDKFYIGKHQTLDPNDDYLGSGKLITRAIEKYGRENFSKEVLYIFESEIEMNDKEREIVTPEFCESEENYNLCPGGNGGFGYINQLSDQTWKVFAGRKSGLKTKNGKFLFLNKEGMFHPNFPKRKTGNKIGNKHKQETKDKIGKINSVLQSGSGNSQYGTMWITDGIVNKKIKKSDELPSGFRRGRIKESNGIIAHL